jgi:hypothetical protein
VHEGCDEKKIAIIGAGVAGAFLANQLHQRYAVTIFEKGRGSGGRLSRLQAHNYSFDKGAQDFCLTDKKVLAVFKPLLDAKILTYWQPRFQIVNKHEKKWESVGDNKHLVGVGHINALVKYFLSPIKVLYGTKISALKRRNNQWMILTDSHTDHGPFDTVIMTQPAEQVLEIAPQFQSALKDITYSSCLMIYLGLKKALSKKQADVMLCNKSMTRWIIQAHLKPGMHSLPGLTIQSKSMSYGLLKKNTETIIKSMLQEVENILEEKLLIEYQAKHIWRYAKCNNPIEHGSLWDAGSGLGVIGDGLVSKTSSGIEAAILSAMDLARRLE